MWNEIRLLTKLELLGMYGVNKFRHEKDKKAKNRYRLLLGAWVLVGAMIVFYVGALCMGLSTLGMAGIIPAYLATIASLIIFFFGIFKAGNTVFSRKGFEFLSALPVHQHSIVLSRFLGMYVQDLILTLAVLLPGGAVYAWFVRPGAGFYGAFLLGSLFVPLLPLVLSTILGAFAAALASRMKRKNIMQSLLTVALSLGVMLLSFRAGELTESATPEMLANLANTASGMIAKLYPPAIWFGNASVQGTWLELLLLAGVSVAAVGAMVAVVARNFQGISQRLFATAARHNYRMGALKSSGMLAALCKREARRYFASSVYVTNTIIGPIMGCILCGALLFVDWETIQAPIPFDLKPLLPFVFAGIFTMMTTSSVSISMEGKQFWIAKTLPVPTKSLLDAKLLFNLLLMLPLYVVAEILLAIAVKPAPAELLWQILIPAALMLFAVTFGLWINLRLHSFDWEKEEAVVKQSASAAIGGFSGLLTALACGVITFLWPGHITKAAICAVLLGLTALMYIANNKTKLETL